VHLKGRVPCHAKQWPTPTSLLSKTRIRAIALAQDLIENQARIVKSCVKFKFNYWCIEASELVDLMINLSRKDEKYLLKDVYPPLKRVSVKSQHYDHNIFLTFEKVVQCFYLKFPISEAPATCSSSSSTTTTLSHTTPPSSPFIPCYESLNANLRLVLLTRVSK
jgi:hypothetical protein